MMWKKILEWNHGRGSEMLQRISDGIGKFFNETLMGQWSKIFLHMKPLCGREISPWIPDGSGKCSVNTWWEREMLSKSLMWEENASLKPLWGREMLQLNKDGIENSWMKPCMVGEVKCFSKSLMGLGNSSMNLLWGSGAKFFSAWNPYAGGKLVHESLMGEGNAQ